MYCEMKFKSAFSSLGKLNTNIINGACFVLLVFLKEIPAIFPVLFGFAFVCMRVCFCFVLCFPTLAYFVSKDSEVLTSVDAGESEFELVIVQLVLRVIVTKQKQLAN